MERRGFFQMVGAALATIALPWKAKKVYGPPKLTASDLQFERARRIAVEEFNRAFFVHGAHPNCRCVLLPSTKGKL